ncbi:MAG: NTP/NDP exchange transporter [Rickettsiales bacterium]|nr:NTP/NDP exchange transporter [Rickettsiales bacterium]
MSLKWLRDLWPIENHEFKKFFPMAFIFCCVLFNYSVLRSIKDSLVVANIGAEAISFIKLYLTFPTAILFAVIYAKMTNLLTQKQIFYCFCFFFLAFFMVFAFILYPNQDFFHPDPKFIATLPEKSMSFLGINIHFAHFKWFILVFGKWSYAMFYVFAELWGSMMLSLLFWQFANSVTKTNEAKRFYPMVGFLGNIGLVAAGQVIKFLSAGGAAKAGKVAVSTANEAFLISSVAWAVSIAILILVGLYTYLNNVVLTDPKFMPASVAKKREKVEMSLLDGLKVVFSSKYLGFIAILLLCYGISINLVEGPWKDSVRRAYPTTVQYANFMAELQTYTGIFTMLAFFISAQILKKISWFSGAILTPLMIAVSGLGFFTFLFLNKTSGGGEAFGTFFMALDPLLLAVFFGLAQNVASKATKYSFFDPTKEMSYIPLDVELQTKGKAAVDIVASRLSKSSGGLLQSTIFILFPAASFADVAPYFMIVFAAICLIWLVDVKLLYSEYRKLVKE